MSELLELGKNACDAKYVLQKLTTEEKNKALQTAANDLCERQEEILAANVLDLENGKNNGMNPGLLDRLKLTGERIAQIAEGLRQIAALPDCIGETREAAMPFIPISLLSKYYRMHWKPAVCPGLPYS